jgi:hypothetical protein
MTSSPMMVLDETLTDLLDRAASAWRLAGMIPDDPAGPPTGTTRRRPRRPDRRLCPTAIVGVKMTYRPGPAGSGRRSHGSQARRARPEGLPVRPPAAYLFFII